MRGDTTEYKYRPHRAGEASPRHFATLVENEITHTDCMLKKRQKGQSIRDRTVNKELEGHIKGG